jgi:hypothetical protein
MKQLIALHLTPAHPSTQDHGSLPCVSALANPTGLVLVVYYFLYHNAVSFLVSWKCIPDKPPSSADKGALIDLGADGGNVKDPPAPDSEGAPNDAKNNVTISTPIAPFSSTAAQSICTASAVLPYPPNMLNKVPLRGIIEYLKTLRAGFMHRLQLQQQGQIAGAPSHLSSELQIAVNNLSVLYFNMHRLLLKLYPESLIGFNVIAAESISDSADVALLHHAELHSEGSLLAIGLNPASHVKAEHSNGRFPSLADLRLWHTGSEVDRLIMIQRLHSSLLVQRDALSSTMVSIEGGSFASYVDAFLLHILRPLLLQHSSVSSNTSGSLQSAAVNLWCSLYSSSLSSSQFVYRTALCVMDTSSSDGADKDVAATWARLSAPWPFEELLFDPLSFLLSTPPRVLRRAPLLRLVLTLLFHFLVASSSYLTTLSKSEYVSALLVRQSRHVSAWHAYTMALKLMGPGPGPLERRANHTSKEVEPMQLHLHHQVEKVAATIFPSSVAAAANAATTHSTGTGGVKRDAANIASINDPSVEIVKKSKIEGGSAATTATTSSLKSEPHAVKTEIVAMEDAGAPIDASSVLSEVQPFSFLVSDRILTPAEQQVFSSDFVLIHPPGCDMEDGAIHQTGMEANAAATTPTLRTFTYMLTTRAVIAQELMQHGANLLAEHAANTASTVSANNTAESLQLLISFLALLFTASTPPGSTAPSSLLLLLHVQSYPLEMLPLCALRFAPQMLALLDEGVLLDRIRAGIGSQGDDSSRATRANFFRLAVLMRDALDRVEEQQEQQQLPNEIDLKPTNVAEQLHLLAQTQPQNAEAFKAWAHCVTLMPEHAHLLRAVCELAISQ